MNIPVLNISVRSYVESGYKPIPPVRLSDEEYGRALQCFVPASTDIVIINRKKKVVYLAQRTSKPMTGWWLIGGKIMPHETIEAAVVRNFDRETGLSLPERRFELVAILDYRLKDRQQEPQTIGCHMQAYTFAVELTPEELTFGAAHLEENEYQKGCGLTSFDRERLVQENVFPAMLDLYDDLFPRTE